MKHIITLALGLCLLGGITVRAEDTEKKKPAMTEEQKKTRKEMLDKYDTNKDGELSQDERSKISAEDKEKMKGLRKGKKKSE